MNLFSLLKGIIDKFSSTDKAPAPSPHVNTIAAPEPAAIAEQSIERFLESQKSFEKDINEVRCQDYWRRILNFHAYFPIYKEVDSSITFLDGAIDSLDEAREFLQHPVLGAHFRDMAQAVLEHFLALCANGYITPKSQDLGACSYDKRLRMLVSSMTLFDLVEPSGLPALMLRIFNQGKRDKQVYDLLELSHFEETVPPVTFRQAGLPQPVLHTQDKDPETGRLALEALIEYIQKEDVSSPEKLHEVSIKMLGDFERSYEDIAMTIVNYCLLSASFEFPTAEFVEQKTGKCRPFCLYMLNKCQQELTRRIRDSKANGLNTADDILHHEVDERVIKGYKTETVHYVDDAHYNGCGAVVSSREVETPIYETVKKRQFILENGLFSDHRYLYADIITLYWIDLVDDTGHLDINALTQFITF